MVRYLFAVVLALGCGSPPAPTGPTPIAAKDDPSCPVLVAGTSVAVEDTSDGAALVFVTTGDVAQVRKRAAALADMHAHHGGGDPNAMGNMIATRSTAAAADVDGGSRVTFTAGDPGDVGKLQSELRMHAHHLTGGTCEMHM